MKIFILGQGISRTLTWTQISSFKAKYSLIPLPCLSRHPYLKKIKENNIHLIYYPAKVVFIKYTHSEKNISLI